MDQLQCFAWSAPDVPNGVKRLSRQKRDTKWQICLTFQQFGRIWKGESLNNPPEGTKKNSEIISCARKTSFCGHTCDVFSSQVKVNLNSICKNCEIKPNTSQLDGGTSVLRVLSNRRCVGKWSSNLTNCGSFSATGQVLALCTKAMSSRSIAFQGNPLHMIKCFGSPPTFCCLGGWGGGVKYEVHN